VESADDSEQAIVSLREVTQNRWGRLKISAERKVDLTLSPTHSAKIVVKNKEAKPVSGASIHVSLTGRLAPFVAGQTDAQGEFLLKLPREINPRSIAAIKANEGIDYVIAETMPELVELSLGGVLPRRVQFMDEEGQTLVGLPLQLSSVQLPGKSSGIGGLPITVTDDEGVATFDDLPPEIIPGQYANGGLELLPQSFLYPTGFHLKIPLDSRQVSSMPIIVLARCGMISGRVLTADGTPVSDLQVRASPSANFWNSSFTDSQGGYLLRKMPNMFENGVPPDYQHTVREANGIVVPRGAYTVIPRAGFDVTPGEVIENFDLTATLGTVLRAKIIINDGEMSFKEYKESRKGNGDYRVILDYQYAEAAPSSPIQGTPLQPKRERIYGMTESLNDNGEATFRVPPGYFHIRPSVSGATVETVDGQKVRSVDFPDYDFVVTPPETEGAERIIECRLRVQTAKTFTLRAVRADDPTVVLSDVLISVYPDDQAQRTQFRNIELTTNEKGEATITRSSKPITFLAFDKEQTLGVSVVWLELSEGQTVIDVPLSPLVKAIGTLVDRSGKPFANKDFRCRMNRTIPQLDSEGKLTRSRLLIDVSDGGISAKTDENGNFEIEGLVRNTDYDIEVTTWNESTNRNENVLRRSFNSGDKEVIDLKWGR